MLAVGQGGVSLYPRRKRKIVVKIIRVATWRSVLREKWGRSVAHKGKEEEKKLTTFGLIFYYASQLISKRVTRGLSARMLRIRESGWICSGGFSFHSGFSYSLLR